MEQSIGHRAERIAESLYGVSGKARRLDGESDLNFRIDTEGGERFVLKLHHPASNIEELELQNAALLHLADAGLALQVPVPKASRDGSLLAEAAWADGIRTTRLLTWIDGKSWDVSSADSARWSDLGHRLAELDVALRDFAHPADARSGLLWRITAASCVAEFADEVDDEMQTIVTEVFTRFRDVVEPQLAQLPTQAIHHDANENNIVLSPSDRVAGIIDFGDVVRVPRIAEIAVASAYAIQGCDDPAEAILPIVAGYDAVYPLHVAELAVLVDLIKVRLAMSITMAARQIRLDPDNEYLLVSQTGVRAALSTLVGTDNELLHFRVRDRLGYEANPAAREIRQYFESGAAEPALMVRPDARRAESTRRRYGATVEGATDHVHVSRTLAVTPGSAVFVPLDGRVAGTGEDWILLAHTTPSGVPFGVVLRGIQPGESGMTIGAPVSKGDRIGRARQVADNPLAFLEVQLQTHTPESSRAELVRAVPVDQFDLWRSVYPDPNLLVRDADARSVRPERSNANLVARRQTNFSRGLSLSYDEPLHIVRGEGAYLYDRAGRGWLDLVNNVCHVGHAHPRVVEAAHRQAQVLNTNTRYLHSSAIEYARRLVELLPDPLRVCFLVNSGSEANDLALRLARAHTGARDALVLDHAYHGNLTSQIDLSPYKFNRAGGRGRPAATWICDLPDQYRGRFHDLAEDEQSRRYAESVADHVESLRGLGRRPAAFFVESLQSCGGQIVLPDGYLRRTFETARAAGAVTVADEIQVGLGRVGRHLWGFELQGVVPDIVTMGKPLGNGHPLAAVVTTPEIARSFENGMEWFNTFGGNPVSAEVGLAVLDVLREEELQAHARVLGTRLKHALDDVARDHALVGDVRGEGLFMGIELSLEERRPASSQARALKEAIKARGVLVSTDGPDDNVIKIKPPMVLTADDCDRFVEVFAESLKVVERASDRGSLSC